MCLKNEGAQLKLFEEYQERFPRAQAPRRLPLSIASGKNKTSILYLHYHTKLVVREVYSKLYL
jgi:hypothetical protein